MFLSKDIFTQFSIICSWNREGRRSFKTRSERTMEYHIFALIRSKIFKKRVGLD